MRCALRCEQCRSGEITVAHGDRRFMYGAVSSCAKPIGRVDNPDFAIAGGELDHDAHFDELCDLPTVELPRITANGDLAEMHPSCTGVRFRAAKDLCKVEELREDDSRHVACRSTRGDQLATLREHPSDHDAEKCENDCHGAYWIKPRSSSPESGLLAVPGRHSRTGPDEPFVPRALLIR